MGGAAAGEEKGEALRAIACPRTAALSAGVLLLGAVPAAALSSGRYSGHTSQREAVSMVVSGRRLEHFTITWVGHCRAPGSRLGPLKTYNSDVALGRHGWSVHGRYTASGGHGYGERFRVSDSATFTGVDTARGRFSAVAEIYRRTPTRHGTRTVHVDTCRSGPVTFTVTRLAPVRKPSRHRKSSHGRLTGRPRPHSQRS